MRMTFDTGRPVPELPFRVVVVGPFGVAAVSGTGAAAAAWPSNGPRGASPGGGPRPAPVRVDGGSLDEALKTLAGSLEVSLPGVSAPVRLALDGIRSFRPEAIARQFPEGAAGAVAREILLGLKAKKLSRSEAVKRLESASLPAALHEFLLAALRPASSTQPGAAAPGAPSGAPAAPPLPPRPDPVSAAMSAAIGAMARPTGTVTREDSEAAAAALAGLDAWQAESVRAVLADPAFRRLEAAWRGLRFLVSRVDFRAGVSVEIVPALAGELESALEELVRAGVEDGGEPVSLVVVAEEVPVSPVNLERLEVLAGLAGSLGAPLVMSVTREDAGELAAGAAWPAFRQRAQAAWLGLAVNPFLARPPYGAESEPVRSFEYSEGPGEELWASPALAVALAAARSFARHGWPTHLEGQDGVIGDIPVRPAAQGFLPLQAMPGPDEAARLAAAGFIPLTAAWNRDEVRILRAPAVGQGAWLAVSLARARLAAVIRRSLAELEPSAAPGDVRDCIAGLIGRLLPGSVEWRVDLVMEPGGAEPALKVTMRVGPPILPAPREMELAFQLG